MKCKICKSKTNWDVSYGLAEYIVCPACHRVMVNAIEKYRKEDCLSETIATMLILSMGECRKRGTEK